jgi:hypothetical protein
MRFMLLGASSTRVRRDFSPANATVLGSGTNIQCKYVCASIAAHREIARHLPKEISQHTVTKMSEHSLGIALSQSGSIARHISQVFAGLYVRVFYNIFGVA